MSAAVQAGYKQTEVGVIPGDWTVNDCRDLCLKIQDGTHFSPTIRGNDFLYVTSKNIRFGFFDASTADRIDAAQHEAIYKRCDVRRGDLLLTKDGANTGNATLNDLHEQFSLLSSVAFLRFDHQKHLAGFFLQQILSAPGQQQIKEAMSGNAITRLTLAKINKLKFPVAPLPEQRAIAAALSDVDALVAKLDEFIAKKRDLKQAAMQQLLTGQTRLPGFSGEWEVLQIGAISDVKTGPFGSSLHESDYVQHGTPIITVEHLGEFGVTRQNLPLVSNEDCKRLRSYVLEIGDIVFSRVGSVDRNALIRKDEEGWLFSGRLLRVRPDKNRVFSPYLSYQFHTEVFKNAVIAVAVGQTMASLNTKILRDLSVAVPTIEEQTAIATILSDMDAELATLEARRDKIRDLKNGMMQELLTGRIRLV